VVKTLAAALAILVLCTVGAAQAALIDHGGGLIYDTVLNITWYDNPNYETHVYGDYVTWVDGLTVEGVTGWRLPTTPGTTTGVTSEGEMGHLFYTTLGNSPGPFINQGPFTNLSGGFYTETAPSGNYYFNFDSGQQLPVNISYWYFWIHGLAVHDGNIGAVPLPPALLLFGTGLVGLAGWRKFRTG
jgi:hypothetical protein